MNFEGFGYLLSYFNEHSKLRICKTFILIVYDIYFTQTDLQSWGKISAAAKIIYMHIEYLYV